jgi:hypothetical protein
MAKKKRPPPIPQVVERSKRFGYAPPKRQVRLDVQYGARKPAPKKPRRR